MRDETSANEERDLIWRLRHPLWQHYNNDPAQLERDATQEDLSLAADEIERLRTALRRIISLDKKNVPKYAQEIANTALILEG